MRKTKMDFIDKTFELYKNKTESDYWIELDGNRVPTLKTILTPEDTHLVSLVEDENYDSPISVYKDEFIERLSPDNIDSCKFWKEATDKFPLFSIAGGIQNITSIEETNELSMSLSNSLGSLKILDGLLMDNKRLKLLEIGPGHGGLQQAIAKNYCDDNYYAIDVNPLFKHPRIFKTDGKTIPDTIPHSLDCVYSINVFQHLSKKQRTEYYRQIYVSLRTGGVFIFGMFVINEENKNWPLWSTRGVNGKIYCNFFRQLTEIDREVDLIKELTDLGYEVSPIKNNINRCHYLTYICRTT